MNYLDLVNGVLRESGITLDSLTSVNFASPPDPFYTKVKNWVAQSWEDIQTDRRDWEFMQTAGVYLIRPKMEVYGIYSSTNASSAFNAAQMRIHNQANDVAFTLMGSTSGEYPSISETITISNNGTLSGYASIATFATTTFQLEPGDAIVTSSGDAFSFKRWGGYDFTATGAQFVDGTASVGEIKRESFRISDYAFDSGQSYTSTSWARLPFVHYEDYLKYGYDRPVSVSKPTRITQLNDGSYALWPPPDDEYHIYFEYTKVPQTLSLYNDEPTNFPARFHKAIMWRALMYWAEFDKDSQQYARAKARYEKFETEMIRDLLPPVKVSYDARLW